MSRILGIDPGVNGACGIVSEAGHYISAFDMPTVLANKSSNRQMVDAYSLATTLRHVLSDCGGELVAVMENVQPMPSAEAGQARRGMGAASAFAFGKSIGIISGVVAALGISLELCAPARWKKHYGLPGGTESKERARELAIRLFPQGNFPRKKDHNKCESLLLAKWFADTRARAFEDAA
jgi:hypothetical protein